jgi:hypothetical protein
MNAISVQQPAAAAILEGQEPVKYLAWQTYHRGPLLIHAAKSVRGKKGADEPAPDSVSNAVIGVVDLVDCVQEERPGADPDEGAFYWVLINARVFGSPIPANGKVGLFQVSDKAVADELARAEVPGRRKKQGKGEE